MIFIAKYFATFSGETRIDAEDERLAKKQLKQMLREQLEELDQEMELEDIDVDILEELPF